MKVGGKKMKGRKILGFSIAALLLTGAALAGSLELSGEISGVQGSPAGISIAGQFLRVVPTTKIVVGEAELALTPDMLTQQWVGKRAAYSWEGNGAEKVLKAIEIHDQSGEDGSGVSSGGGTVR